MNLKMKNRGVLAAGLVVVGLASTANAQKMLFDFGGNTGTEAGMITSSPDASGNTWNNMWVPFIADTKDTTGANSGIGIGFVSNYGANGGLANGGLFSPPAALDEFAIETVTQDYYYATPLDPNLPMLTFDMWGYDDANTATFRFFGSGANFVDQITRYTIRNTNGESVSGEVLTSGFAIGGGGLTDGNDSVVVELSGLHSVGGLITIDVEVVEGDFAYINGMSVEIVPGNSCPADMNGDEILDNGDIGAFVAFFLGGNLAADFNGDGILDNGDIGAFVAAFLAGC